MSTCARVYTKLKFITQNAHRKVYSKLHNTVYKMSANVNNREL